MKTALPFILALSLCAFATEKYGVYDLKGNRISTFEAERHELPEKTLLIKSDNPHKKLYVSSTQKGKGSKPTSRYRAETGAYVEATRNETFSICPPNKKAEGTWISEYSVALDEKNCVSVQTPDLAGTFRILFMENSGRMDTIQVLVDQSYIQMEDYSHIVYVADTAKVNAGKRGNPRTTYLIAPGYYESRKFSQSLIVDKTKFTAGDAWRYSKIDTGIIFTSYQLEKYKNLEGSKLPLAIGATIDEWRFANERSKMEGLDTAYIKVKLPDNSFKIALDTSASGYRVPTHEEWFPLMRAGASTRYYWGDETDSLTVSRYAWVRTAVLKPVAQLQPNAFGLYDMLGIANEMVVFGVNRWPSSCSYYPAPECVIMGILTIGSPPTGAVCDYKNCYKGSFRLLRKTPKLHKLEKF